MSKKPFEKFINKPVSGAKKKEALRQEKKKLKAEARAQGEERRKIKLEKQRGGWNNEVRSTKYEVQKRQTLNGKRENTHDKRQTGNDKRQAPNDRRQTGSQQPGTGNQQPVTTSIPLNKFIAHAGVCGRREAAEMVKKGLVIVNGNKIIEPGFKVSANDKITINGKQLFLQKNLVYILVNKPKDYITTTDDPQGRKTILDLIKGASKERVYPVGRLDRNTTGVLLLTNDGELAQKLTHPSYEIKKLYEVKLDKPLTKNDFEAVMNGVTLEDGFVKADAVAYADAKDKTIIGIEIHSGRNRIVRRIFEHLGYDVKNLDRVMFANLTKKNVERGKWRFLQEKEIRLLKFMNQSFLKKSKE